MIISHPLIDDDQLVYEGGIVIKKRLRTVSLAGSALLIVILLVGCIQPVSEQELAAILTSTEITYTPTLPPTATYPVISTSAPLATSAPVEPVAQPTTAGVTGNPELEQFVQSRGHAPNNLVLWNQQMLGPDQLYGFSYTNQNNEPCVGYLLTAFTNGVWQPNNGGLSCGPVGTEALAGETFFITSDGQTYTIVFGRVDNATVTALAIVYDDASNQTTDPVQGGFIFLKPGVAGSAIITAVDAFGNTVIVSIPVLPPV